MAFIAEKIASKASPEEGVDPLRLAAYVALITGTVIHFIGLDQTLWFDETGTGAIVAPSSLKDSFELMLVDVNAPLYYLILHFWTGVFGLSNIALRVPSAIFAAAAAWIALASRSIPTRGLKFYWGALLALWIPGFTFAHEARCYALLILLATFNTILFVQLLLAPARRVAFGWAAVGVLLLLTHYYAGFLIAIQSIILLVRLRGGIVPLWPAALVFVPLPIWLAFHLGHFLPYLNPQIAWYSLLGPSDLWTAIDVLSNFWIVAALAVLLFLASLLWWPRPVSEEERALWLVPAAALVSVGVVVAIGFIRPCFTFRYLMPFGPGALFGLALIFCRIRRNWEFAPLIILCFYSAIAFIVVASQINSPGRAFSFERAAQALMAAKTDRIVLFFDNPANRTIDPRLLTATGRFFFMRAGVPVEVTPVFFGANEDPNKRLIEEARAHDAAILWIYYTGFRGTVARLHPPMIDVVDKTWTCRDFGRDHYGIVACRQKTKAA
ncbi:MAG TPA: hypothetical protein VKV77_14055 [Methylovirgula sp.]|nr:hypothetical protein [Methylovirgula sp.]